MSHATLSPLMQPRTAPSSEWFVIIETGSLAGQRFPLDSQAAVLTLGRDPSCTIQFDPNRERMVGRRHAHIELRGDGLYLVDDSSANGTFKDGQAVSQVRLEHGDRFQLGGEVEGAQGPWVSIYMPAHMPAHMPAATHLAPPRTDAVTLITRLPAVSASPSSYGSEPDAGRTMPVIPAIPAAATHAAPPAAATYAAPQAAAAVITPLLGLAPVPARVALGAPTKGTSAVERYDSTAPVSTSAAGDPLLRQRRTQLFRQIAGTVLLLLLSCTIGVILGMRQGPELSTDTAAPLQD